MIIFVLEYLFVFMTGSILGWLLEVVYRRYFGLARKWINPGFLQGPYLPLYGSALSILYIISKIPMPMVQRVLIFGVVTTLLEYVTGLFFLKVYKTRLWDYSNLRVNVQGIISPIYSFFWVILSLVFYFFLYPFFYEKVQFLYKHLEFSLIVGFSLGIFFIDSYQSFNVLVKLKHFREKLEESKFTIHYEILKMEIREKLSEFPGKAKFFFPFRGDFSLIEQLKTHQENRKKGAQ